jgi:hypothetical protein
MARRLVSARLTRLAAVVAVFALPSVATAVARAAIAGASPAVTAGRPDLRSATITTPTQVHVCFDKALSSKVGQAGDFFLVGYRSANDYAASTTPPTGGRVGSVSLDPTNGECVFVNFPTTASGAPGEGDINQYTVFAVLAGAVTDNLTALPNNEDSVALTGSTSNNGTAAHTTGPDLVGILTPSGSDLATNDLEFIFDQAVVPSAPGAPVPSDFYLVDQGGNLCRGSAVGSVSGSTVVVHFAKPCTASNTGYSLGSIAAAVRGGVFPGATLAANDNGSGTGTTATTESPPGSTTIPGNSSGDTAGSTALPDLQSAVLGASGDTVLYTFDAPVAIANPTGFDAWLSDGQLLSCAAVSGCSASLIGPDEVSVSFGQTLSSQDEYAVLGGVEPGAVQPQANPSGKFANTWESAAVGDNAGALARGFTTAPDVFGVVFDPSNGTVTLDLDQRVSSVDRSKICMLNSAGDEVANPNPVSASIPTAAAGPEAITLSFVGGPTGPVAQGSMISFGCNNAVPINDALHSSLDSFGYDNPAYGGTDSDGNSVAQIVAPVGSGARLRGYQPVRKHHGNHKRRHGA